MKNSIVTFIFLVFMSFITIQTSISHLLTHCSSHCETEADHHDEGDPEQNDHHHAGTCIHNYCVSFAAISVATLEIAEKKFPENLFFLKPEPFLDGPLQPPRLS